MAVEPVPDGYHTLTSYLRVRGAAEAIEYYREAFGAVEILRLPAPGGKVGHAEIRIGDSPLMLADEVPEQGIVGPASVGDTTVSLLLYVEDADAVFDRAVAAGGKPLRPMADQFYGDRSGTLTDPFGHQWTVATHREDLSPEELDRRMKEMMKRQGGA